MKHVNIIFAACECFVNESVIYLKNEGIAIQIKLLCMCLEKNKKGSLMRQNIHTKRKVI